MMNLGTYLLGGLSTEEAQNTRRHIDTCTYCQRELTSLRPITDLLSTAELDPTLTGERIEPDPSLATRLLARAEQEIDASSPTRPSEVHDRVTPIDKHANDRVRRLSPRRRNLAIAGLAFALGAASTVGVQQVASKLNEKPSTGQRIQFVTQTKNSDPATATADQGPKAWAWVNTTSAGTYAWLYTRNLKPGVVYGWWFEKADGTRVGLGTFRFPGDQKDWLVCPGSTSVLRSEFVYIGATDDTGKEVLRAKLPPAELATN